MSRSSVHDERRRVGDVVLGVGEPDGFQVVAAETGRQDHDAIGRDGRRNRIHRRARAVPDDLAGFEVVAARLASSPLVTTCARPPCSTMSGVAQESISSRAVRQRSSPVRLSSATMNDSPW